MVYSACIHCTQLCAIPNSGWIREKNIHVISYDPNFYKQRSHHHLPMGQKLKGLLVDKVHQIGRQNVHLSSKRSIRHAYPFKGSWKIILFRWTDLFKTSCSSLMGFFHISLTFFKLVHQKNRNIMALDVCSSCFSSSCPSREPSTRALSRARSYTEGSRTSSRLPGDHYIHGMVMDGGIILCKLCNTKLHKENPSLLGPACSFGNFQADKQHHLFLNTHVSLTKPTWMKSNSLQ